MNPLRYTELAVLFLHCMSNFSRVKIEVVCVCVKLLCNVSVVVTVHLWTVCSVLVMCS